MKTKPVTSAAKAQVPQEGRSVQRNARIFALLLIALAQWEIYERWPQNAAWWIQGLWAGGCVLALFALYVLGARLGSAALQKLGSQTRA